MYYSSAILTLVIQDLLSTVYATRVSDGRPVCIKRVGSLSFELLSLKALHEDTGRFDPENHCIPVIEVFVDDERKEMSYIVMPALDPVSPSRFKRVSEVVEFTSQVLLGLHYMHRKKIAHRDCSLHSIMSDARATCNGEDDHNRSSLPRQCQTSSKAASATMTYYFVGFRGAIECLPGDGRFTSEHQYTKDQEPPEFRDEELPIYDPLHLDVFLVGNMLRREFLDKYSNVGFLRDLIKHMMHDAPEERKDARGVLRVWFRILPRISSFQRAQRLHRLEEPWWRINLLPKIMSSTRTWGAIKKRRSPGIIRGESGTVDVRPEGYALT
ncbi:hypothetical protein BDY19DRAFT_1008061 [Irpex rosettiformis]|uniref:Uncharacterized protein n=1 Tax=Irpex rosettiformis TaxID=378272 RepID=A0ACB8U368_9APHY|nr:hypothetical protein BDY19DRAFT_1008061 [Irpex rosettiformis]